MKKSFSFLYLFFIFAITTAIFYFSLSFLLKDDSSGWGGVVESIIWLIIWGIIFIYFIVRKLTSNKLESTHSVKLSLIITTILLAGIILWICVGTGIIG